MRPQVRILSSRPLNVQVVSFGWRLFCLHREGEICGIRCWFTSYMGRGEFFRLRRSAKWPPRLFLRAKVVRRLTRRSDIGPPCWISLSASPAGSRFASAGEKSHLFLRYYLPTNPRYSRSASAGENHPPSLATAYQTFSRAVASLLQAKNLASSLGTAVFSSVLGRALLRSHYF